MVARRRRKKKWITTSRTLLVGLVVGGCWLWLYRINRGDAESANNLALMAPAFVPPSPAATKLLARTEPEAQTPAKPAESPQLPESVASATGTANSPVASSTIPANPNPVATPGKPAAPKDNPPPAAAPTVTAGPVAAPPTSGDPVRALIHKAQQAISAGDVLAARTHFSQALLLDPNGPESDVLRDELSRLGEETIASSKIVTDDPLVERYVIKDGDSLAKIAAQYFVSSDLLARVNGIADKNRIRAGQTIKTIKGPFHASVSKSKFRLDMFVQDVLVKSYSVGLGADGSTPTGQWRVAVKLVNPTYYPPRGGDILSADDPTNPLGERWIGLVGVSGEALGQERYGIHGTIEPESIGKNASLGCIRLRNADVEALYDFLVEKHSTITITD